MDGAHPDDDYPEAPLPRHERSWRHPSEIGEAVWVRTEPPLAIGRGLMVATGMIGVLIAVGVLWATMPTDAGDRSAAVNTLSSNDVTERPPRTSSTTSQLAVGTALRSSTTVASSTSTIRATASSTTVHRAPRNPPTPTTLRTSAVAVSVGGQSMLLTTANAVHDNSVVLVDDDGNDVEASVIFVDTERGLAVLAPDPSTPARSFAVAALARPGQTVTVLTDDSVTVSAHVAADGSIAVESWTGADVADGTPVVNEEGSLVGLCSHDAGAPRLVAVGNIDSLKARADAVVSTATTATSAPTATTQPIRTSSTTTSTIAATTSSSTTTAPTTTVATPTTVAPAPRPAWLGVVLVAQPAASLTVSSVDAAGPAARAGVQPGDSIHAIGSTTLASGDELAKAIGEHAPGDQITLTLRHADGSQVVLGVTLGARPPAL